MSKSKKLTNIFPETFNEKLYEEKKQKTGIHIGFTYLEKNPYGLKNFFEAVRGKKSYIDDLNDFISAAREINDIGEFISAFVSHNKSKNSDERSKKMVERLNTEYNLEVDNLIHLHCKRGGTGEFVVHGFQTGNIFEIVWLDPKHEIHGT